MPPMEAPGDEGRQLPPSADCPRCGAMMRLLGVLPHEQHSNLVERRYRCETCGKVTSEVVARAG